MLVRLQQSAWQYYENLMLRQLTEKNFNIHNFNLNSLSLGLGCFSIGTDKLLR